MSWQNFLSQQIFAPYDGASPVFCPLEQFATLRVAGEEAQSFLQNLLSNDIREVSTSQAQLSSFNSAKGRMLASFLIWREGEDYLLQLPVSLRDALLKKLSMYVLRAKVKITDNSNHLISLGFYGDSALLPAGAAELPIKGVLHTAELSLIRLGERQFMLNLAPDQAQAAWQRLAQQAVPVASRHWDWLNIRAGLPVILPETQDEFVPQMVNFELIGGINFKKGCYPGQEIVARMHYLGKAKRRMYLAHLASDTAPQPGDPLYAGQDTASACGMIANAAPAPGGGCDVLAVLMIESHDGGQVHTAQGAPLQFMALPYSLP